MVRFMAGYRAWFRVSAVGSPAAEALLELSSTTWRWELFAQRQCTRFRIRHWCRSPDQDPWSQQATVEELALGAQRVCEIEPDRIRMEFISPISFGLAPPLPLPD